jgi:hypothetical protein
MRRLKRTALLGALLFAVGFAYARFWWGPGPETLERQRREVRVLSERLEARLRERALLRDGVDASVLVGVPSQVADRLAADAVQGLFGDVKLALHDLRFRKEDEVQARLLVGKRTVGRFVLSVHVREVTARLRPGRPRLRFAEDRIDVTLPVGVEGEGRAFLRFTWDGRGIAGAVCGDLDVTHELQASVPLRSYGVAGALRLRVDGPALVATPEFEDVPLSVPIEPSAATWRFVEELIAGRGALCRAALGKAEVEEKIKALLSRGIPVTLPGRLLERPLRLPLAVERSLTLPGRSLRVEAQPRDLILTPARLWYGVAVSLGEGETPL